MRIAPVAQDAGTTGGGIEERPGLVGALRRISDRDQIRWRRTRRPWRR
jgi:hypothetical protein